MTQAFEIYDASATLMCFIQFLAANAISFRVINNYMSALKLYFGINGMGAFFEGPLVKRMLRGIQYSCVVTPTPKGLFSLHQIREISQLCDSFECTLTYRCAYLLAFYGLFRISNLALKSASMFDPARHLLRDVPSYIQGHI